MQLQSSKRNIDYKKFFALVEKLKVQEEFNKKAKKDYFGSAPNVFVGRFGYPNVDVGILNTEEALELNDSPKSWSAQNLQIPEIVKMRARMVNSNFMSSIKARVKDKLLEIGKEVSLASKPADIEVNLKKAPKFSLSLDQELTAYGPSIKLERAKLTENPKIPHKVEKVVSDELKAVEQVEMLYKSGFDEHYLTKVLSMGNLGMQAAKKLVPTRWSITATDDMLGKQLIKDIKNFYQTEYSAFFGGYLGNYYLILSFPDAFRYELFEIDPNTGKAWTDYEDVFGRKDYASTTAGGYYAARLAILEKLKSIKRQGSILALRFMTDEYYLGLGVWVVREAARKSLQSKPIVFESRDLLLKFAKSLAKKKFSFDLEPILKKSSLLQQVSKQKKIWEY